MKTLLRTVTLLAAMGAVHAAPMSGPAAAIADDVPNRLKFAAQAIELNPPREALLEGSTALVGHPLYAQLLTRIDFAKLNDEAAKLMAEQFTAEELQALVKFQSSETGKQIGMKMPGYQKLLGALVQNHMKAALDQYMMTQKTNGGLMNPGYAPIPTPTTTPKAAIPGMPTDNGMSGEGTPVGK